VLLSKQPIKQTDDEDEVAGPHPSQRAAHSWKRGTARFGEWASEGERNAVYLPMRAGAGRSVIKCRRMSVRAKAGEFFAKPGGTAEVYSVPAGRSCDLPGFLFCWPILIQKEN